MTRASSDSPHSRIEQPDVEGAPGAGIGPQPALEPPVQDVPDQRLADHQVPRHDDGRQRGGPEVGE